MKYQHFIFIFLLPFLFSSCALLFWGSENGEIKRAYAKHKADGGQIYYSKKDVNLHRKIRMKKIAVKLNYGLSLTAFPNGNLIEGSLQAKDTTLGLSFYSIGKVKGHKSNWALWNTRKNQLTLFYTDQDKPETFAVKPSDIGPRLASKKANIPSKRRAAKDIEAMRLRIEAIKAEEKRISDSIAEANTLKGKEITKFELKVDQSLGGLGGEIRLNVIAHLKNGRTLSTKGLPGGLTQWADYEISSSFKSFTVGVMGLPRQLSEMQDEFEVTVKSAYGNGPTLKEKIIIRYPSSFEIKEDGEKGMGGSSGSSANQSRTTGDPGHRGQNGSDGGTINVVIKPLKHKATGENLALVEYADGMVYVLSAGANLSLSAKGGDGGTGGTGGSGYCSTSFSCRGSGANPSPRYGGSGGPGGQGGNGGNGGRIRVRYEAGAPRLQISTDVRGGSAGKAGRGGDGGCDMTCQGQNYSATKSRKHPDGSSGSAGSAGRDGSAKID